MATKKKPERGFTQEERPKIDVRVGVELDSKIEAVAKKLGTTKNSVVIFAAWQFCKQIEGSKAPSKKEIEDRVAELFGEA